MIRNVRTHCSTEMICSCFSTLDLDNQNKSCRADRMLDPVPTEKKKNSQVTFKNQTLKISIHAVCFWSKACQGLTFPREFKHLGSSAI